MRFLKKLCLALSCFMPLYVVFGAKNLMAAYQAFQFVEGKKYFEGQNDVFCFNAKLTILWMVLFFLSVVGIVCFIWELWVKKSPSAGMRLVKAENITADYYFSYFSLFVLSFYSVDPTQEMDIAIFGLLKIMIIWVYIVNDMYFINPVLNLLGYRSFAITYAYDLTSEKDICLECRVLSRERLNKCEGEKFYILFSKCDFTTCIRPEKLQKK